MQAQLGPIIRCAEQPPTDGEIWILVVAPPPAYAGKPGARAVVESVTLDAIYVLFQTGLRESYPPGRFATYFEREARSRPGKHAA